MNSDASSVAARIRECAEIAGSGDELARRTGIPRRTLENYLAGDSEPKASRAAAIARAAGVSLDWLITGDGPRDLSAGVNQHQTLNANRLRWAIELIETVLDLEERMMPASERAKLILYVYESPDELSEASEPASNQAKIRRVLRLVA